MYITLNIFSLKPYNSIVNTSYEMKSAWTFKTITVTNMLIIINCFISISFLHFWH
jgi:hypothetical protein